MITLLRSDITTDAPGGLDLASLRLLSTLTEAGSVRQGELADQAQLDPSTTSRHVAQLVRAGLVERLPDPIDGRAVQLVVTDAGQRIASSIRRRSEVVTARVLLTWDDDDVLLLARLVARLNEDIARDQGAPGTAPS